MTAALLWKEYRQQRAIWLAIAFLAMLLVVILAQTLGHGSNWEVFQQEPLRSSLEVLLVCLGVSYGVVSGAMLLAGETDEGTIVFLDCLTGLRGPLFVRKVLAGALLTLSLSVFLSGMALALGIGSWESILILPLQSLDALIWGLLAGALCRKVLTACLAGIGFLAASWTLALLPMLVVQVLYFRKEAKGSELYVDVALLLAKTFMATGGAYVSWCFYCRTDSTRIGPLVRLDWTGWENEVREGAAGENSAGTWAQPRRFRSAHSTRVLLWLTYRQGRWVLLGTTGGALLLAITLSTFSWQPFFWPLGTLILGLICGLAVFVPDQIEGRQLLGAQRLPPGRIWTVQILFWGTVLVSLMFFAGLAFMVADILLYDFGIVFDANHRPNGEWLKDLEDSELFKSPLVCLGLWPLYGFCFGQFFGQILRRPVLAIILAVVVTPFVVALWIPSLAFGGLPTWQLLILPGLLLLMTRVCQWPWLSGRLLTARPLAGIGASIISMVLAVVGCLWYRVAEVPDVSEPFDVKAYLTSLPTPEKNSAGPLLRNAAHDMNEARLMVRSNGRSILDLEVGLNPFDQVLQQIKEQGWPKQDMVIGAQLNKLFDSPWVQEAQQAAESPLGMIYDPRSLQMQTSIGNTLQSLREMAFLYRVRSLQLQAHGDSRGALEQLKIVLALSRQVRNKGFILANFVASNMESEAFAGLQTWLQHVGPNKELIQEALAILQRHEAALPDPADAFKTDYLIQTNSDPCGQVPWEKERNLRILNAVVFCELRELRKPFWQNHGYEYPESDEVAWLGLPPENGLGFAIGAEHWSELFRQFKMNGGNCNIGPILRSIATGQQKLAAIQLTIAVALYQADHGKPPEKLDVLVPAYLPGVPNDATTGGPFGYQISSGEKIEGGNAQVVILVPGQALIWTWKAPSADGPSPHESYYPVPVWTRKEKP